MKTTVIYKLLKLLLIGSILMVCYGIVDHIFDVDFFRNSLPYGAILFQIIVLLLFIYKIIENLRVKKPIGNLVGVTVLVATAFIGATYLYGAIMEVLTK